MAARKKSSKSKTKSSKKTGKTASSASKKGSASKTASASKKAKKKASAAKTRSASGSTDVVYSDIRRSAGVLSRLLRIS